MTKPNLFILGAPKCGTTALRDYLGSHPEVFSCAPDEPHFFSTDLVGRSTELSEKQYLRKYFSGVKKHHKIIIDKSTWYLYSKNAVSNILRFNPDSKFIVMVRNPVDMDYSLHSQLLWTGEEDISDFETSWHLQDDAVEY